MSQKTDATELIIISANSSQGPPGSLEQVQPGFTEPHDTSNPDERREDCPPQVGAGAPTSPTQTLLRQSSSNRWQVKDSQYNCGYNEAAVITEGTVMGQFFASVKKNVLLKTREPCNLILEIVIPIIFVLLLVLIWSAISNDDNPERDFLNTSQNKSLTQFFDDNRVCMNGTAYANTKYSQCDWSAISNPTSPAVYCVDQIKNGDPATSKSLCMEYNAMYAIRAWSGEESPLVPDLDQIILFRILQTSNNIGKIHFAGNSATIASFRDYAGKTSVLFPYVSGLDFVNADVANDYTSNGDNEGETWGIVEFNEVSQDAFSASLHFNKSDIPGTNVVQDRFSSGGLGENHRLYAVSGFFSWQRAVNEYYYNFTNRVAPQSPEITPMPFIAYTDAIFLQGAGTLIPLLIVFSFLYPVSQQTKRLVEEKEKRIREAMLIMGLGSGSFYASHWMTYHFIYLLCSLLSSILLNLTIFSKSSFFIIFFLFYFFCLSCMSLASLMSSLFSKSRLAALLSPLLFFVIAMPFFAVESSPSWTKSLFSLMSPSAFAIGCDLIAKYEISTGLGSKEFASSQDDFTMAAVFVFLIFDTVWYFLLALWFDNVLPSEWGTQEHACFCFLRCVGLCREKKQPEGCENDARDLVKGEFEPNPLGKPSVELKGLRKEFTRGKEKFIAVNDLTLNMYEGQITVILGHNGAGKTTAINLMTGMLAPDGGDCLVYGKSVSDNMRGVRQEIGFCPQHNILWDDMTCREHLEYFAKLKGLEGQEMENAVQETIRAVDLMPKLDMPSSSLSGGMKRKLSVAIAFVGKSRVVFLDEPTAGMDVSARRHTWDLIKRMSPGRTIVLTTHYMDEADLLGNSIAIMSKGKLKCQGSSLFLKSRLGVGYLLNCAIEAAADVEQITGIVTGNVTEAETLTSVSGEVSYRLPMSEVGTFPTMLEALENGAQSLGLKSFGISVTTMEEVFLKIGHDEEEQEIKAEPQDDGSNLVQNGDDATVRIDADAWHIHKSQESGAVRQFMALYAKRFANAKRDTRTQVFQIWMPIGALLLAMLLALIGPPANPPLELAPAMYKTPVEVPVTDCSSVYEAMGTQLFTSAVVKADFSFKTTNATEFSLHLQDTYKAHEYPERMTAIVCGHATGKPYVLHNASAGIHAAPEALQQYYRAHLKATYGTQVDTTIWSAPLKLSDRETVQRNSFSQLFIGILILIPFTFIPSTFVSFVVKERECKAKHAQLISGMNPFVYWVSNFCFDICCFLLTNVLAIIIFLIFDREEYVGGVEEFFGIFILLLLYACAGITGAYFCSFAFEASGTAQNVVMLTNFIAGFVLVIAVWMFQFFDATKDAGKILPYFTRIVPSYCLGEGILNMASRELYGAFGEKPGVFDMDVLGWNMLYMGIEFPLFLGLSMLLDHPARQMAASKLLHKPGQKPAAIEGEDPDVLIERQEVESGARDDDLVLVKNMCKVYPSSGPQGDKTAVRNLSFGVRRGEVFGFLGTNGAGKTTSMSILSGEQLPTMGYGSVGGFDVVNQAADARRIVGYCPQFDATMELLDAEEHLYLYAGLRGIEKSKVAVVVDSLIEKAGLAPHRKTLAGNMSGGNRRKLSVAIALIGAPTVVMLDEPSAGMDPMARRALWDVIQTVATTSAVVLTTHHLEEVEALSNRVAIMVNGGLKCIGTLQALKHKFGSGFEMSVRVESEARCHHFRQFMSQNFPAAAEQEFRQQKFTFSLPEDTKLSATFRMIEQAKVSLGITDYSVSQTSLEQVFLRIGAQAEEDEENAKALAAAGAAVGVVA